MNKTSMYTCEGEVLEVEEITDRFGYLLRDDEKAILERNLDGVVEDPLEAVSRKPLTLNSDFGKESEIELERSGERSAYWNERDLKFKGCNPQEGSHPNVYIDFEEMTQYREDEPSGTMHGEEVIREVLGIACLEEANINNVLKPCVVYEYPYDDEERFCLVEKSSTNTRAEELYQDSTPRGEEFGFKSPLSLDKYTGQMVEILADMQLNGFFRRPVDSHPRNVLVGKDGEVFPCDFSNFEVRKPTVEMFFTRCLSEAIESSPMIGLEKQVVGGEGGIDYERLNEVFEKYTEASNFYREYKGELCGRREQLQEMFGEDIDIQEEIENAEANFPVITSALSSVPANVEEVLEKIN